jgi:hypothetical protein
MAYFDVNPTATGGSTSIASALAGSRARFLAFGIGNNDTTTTIVRIYDGTVAAGTVRVRLVLGAGDSHYFHVTGAGQSVFPKSWWTSGNDIQVDLDAAGDVRIFGEIVQEP